MKAAGAVAFSWLMAMSGPSRADSAIPTATVDNAASFDALRLHEARRWAAQGRGSGQQSKRGAAVIVIDEDHRGRCSSEGHGDAVTSLLQAALDNDKTVSRVPIVVLRVAVAGRRGACPESDQLASALSQAARLVRGARARRGSPPVIVNISHEIVAGNAFAREPSPVVVAGLHELEDAGAVVVLAAGNDRIRLSKRGFLADFGNLVLVGALDHAGKALWREGAYGSRFGPAVDVYAPGQAMIIGTVRGPRRSLTGTSLAAPLVSAVLALAVATHPCLTPRALLAALLATTTSVLDSTGETLRRPDALSLLQSSDVACAP